MVKPYVWTRIWKGKDHRTVITLLDADSRHNCLPVSIAEQLGFCPDKHPLVEEWTGNVRVSHGEVSVDRVEVLRYSSGGVWFEGAGCASGCGTGASSCWARRR
jgi:hypothetical protein